MPATAPEAVDGRQSRTARSRRAICEAALDLVQEGVLQPSADQVAERAGMSRRSIFNHFADLAELYDAVVEAGMERCFAVLEVISPDEPLGARIEKLARSRARFLEDAAPFAQALMVQTLVGPDTEDAVRVARTAVRPLHTEVEQLFAPELAHLPAGERSEVLEAVAAVLVAPHWEFLRRNRGLSSARARAVMERSVHALLRDAGADL
jgi:AcrR family transcriptional regulator